MKGLLHTGSTFGHISALLTTATVPSPLPLPRNPETARAKDEFDSYYNESTFGSPSTSEADCSMSGVKELQIFPMMVMATTKPSVSRHEEEGEGKSLTFRNTSSEEDEESSCTPPIGAPGWTTPGSGSAKHNIKTNDNTANNTANNNSDNLTVTSPVPSSHINDIDISMSEPPLSPRRRRPPREAFPLADAV